MLRLLCTLGALGTMSGIMAGVASPDQRQLAPRLEVVGTVKPLFLGTSVVSASALPSD